MTDTHRLHRPDGSRGAPGAVGMGLATLACLVALSPLAALQPRPDSSGFVTSGGGARLYYGIFGGGTDTVIVPGGMLLEKPLAPLTGQFTLVFYDPRGRGRSDWIADPRRLTMADEVRDLEAVRRELRIGRAAVIGVSYLGLAAALYAAEHPNNVTRLVQIGPLAPDELTNARYAPPERKRRSDAGAARFHALRVAAADTANPTAECRRWYEAYTPLYVGDEADASLVTTELCAYENETPWRMLWRTSQLMRSLGQHWDVSRRAAAIRAPTLVIQGDHDLVASPDGGRQWAELVPDARLIMLAGAGHLTYIERADRVIPALMRFLSGEWPPESMRVRSVR